MSKPPVAQLGVRIPADLRSALEAEAERANLTMSQVAIKWMEAGRGGCSERSHLSGYIEAIRDQTTSHERADFMRLIGEARFERWITSELAKS